MVLDLKQSPARKEQIGKFCTSKVDVNQENYSRQAKEYFRYLFATFQSKLIGKKFSFHEIG
jgi:hypothetical protein